MTIIIPVIIKVNNNKSISIIINKAFASDFDISFNILISSIMTYRFKYKTIASTHKLTASNIMPTFTALSRLNFMNICLFRFFIVTIYMVKIISMFKSNITINVIYIDLVNQNGMTITSHTIYMLHFSFNTYTLGNSVKFRALQGSYYLTFAGHIIRFAYLISSYKIVIVP